MVLLQPVPDAPEGTPVGALWPAIADLNGDGWLDIFSSSYFNKKERGINCYLCWNDHGSFSLTNR